MKKMLGTTVLLMLLYLFASQILEGLFAALFGIKWLGTLIGYALTVFFAYLCIGRYKDNKSFGVCVGDYTDCRPIAGLAFIMLATNLPYFFCTKIHIYPMLFVQCLLIGIMEELIFRGSVYRMTEKKWGENRAMIISSVAFGLIHLLNIGDVPLRFTLLQVTYAFAIGLVFAVVRAKSGSILIPVIVHTLVDVLGLAPAKQIFAVDLYGAVISYTMAAAYYAYYLRGKKAGETAAA